MSRNLIASGSPVGGRSILEGVRHASTCFPLLVDPGRDSKEWRQPREPLRWFAPVASIDPRSAHKDHRRVGAGRGRLWSGHHQVEPLVLPRKRTFAAQIPARPVWTRPGSARFARTTRSWPSTTSRRSRSSARTRPPGLALGPECLRPAPQPDPAGHPSGEPGQQFLGASRNRHGRDVQDASQAPRDMARSGQSRQLDHDPRRRLGLPRAR